MEKVEMMYLPALVKKPEEDIILFSQGALSGYCLNTVTWNAIPGECGGGPSIPAAECESSPKVSWHEVEVWANSLGTACPSCMGCAYTESEQAHPGSSWRPGVLLGHVGSPPSPAASTQGYAWEQEGQGHMWSVNAEMQAMVWVVSEREKAKASRDLGKTWLFLKEFSRVDAMSCRRLGIASISLRKGGN